MNLGIRAQLVLLVALPLFLVSLSIGVLMTSSRLGDLDRSLDRRGAELVEQIIRMSEFYLFSGDVEELKLLGDRVLSMENVLGVEFLKPNKTLLTRSFSRGDSEKNGKSFISAVYSTGVDVDDFSGGHDSGEVLLGYIRLDLSTLEKVKLREEVIIRGILITGILMFIGASIGGWFGYRISHRMDNIRSTVEKLGAGELAARCKEDAVGEMRSLQGGINSMAERIEKNEITLREQIEQATYALKNSVRQLEDKNQQLEEARETAIKHEREKALIAERERIMQDMHDGIGGQLVASMAILENYQYSGLDVDSTYEEIKNLLRECLDDLRLVIDSLDCSTDKLGVLMGMFRHRNQKRIEAAGINLVWDVEMLPENIAFSPHENLHILRIIQEAITNVIKHANADTLLFLVGLEEEDVHICIQDNGECVAKKVKGRGVVNMQRRAAELGATLNIEQTSKGRRVDLFLPIPLLDIPS